MCNPAYRLLNLGPEVQIILRFGIFLKGKQYTEGGFWSTSLGGNKTCVLPKVEKCLTNEDGPHDSPPFFSPVASSGGRCCEVP